MTADRVARIRSLLQAAFEPEELEVVDESHLHVGHPGAATGMGHFRVRLVSQRFAGVKTLERHRMVYDALADLMKTDIHALSVTALVPRHQKSP
jgi:BolA family transcriptional regulator, general stress-responsive regulator